MSNLALVGCLKVQASASSAHSHISISEHLHICTSAHPHIRIFAHLHIRTSAHLHICTFAHPHIRTSAHLHICTFAYLHIRTFAHLHIKSYLAQKPMNFLSHFYFDRDTTDAYLVLGTVMPDLLKNADKTVIIHPEKLVHTNGAVNSIIMGWKKHLEVDRYFHSSEFFLTHSHELKKKLLPAIEGSPVKPFFLGHIALELILDNLLLTSGQVTAEGFYEHLDGCEESVVDEFLRFAGLKNTGIFFRYYDEFKRSKYLYTYSKTREIAYALKRICMRVWTNPFSGENEAAMTAILMDYRTKLTDNYMSIFYDINDKLLA